MNQSRLSESAPLNKKKQRKTLVQGASKAPCLMCVSRFGRGNNFQFQQPPFTLPSMWVLCAFFKTPITTTKPSIYSIFVKILENQFNSQSHPFTLSTPCTPAAFLPSPSPVPSSPQKSFHHKPLTINIIQRLPKKIFNFRVTFAYFCD